MPTRPSARTEKVFVMSKITKQSKQRKLCEGAKNSFVAIRWIIPGIIPVIFVMGKGKPAALNDGHRA
jgi:hypothetical protein